MARGSGHPGFSQAPRVKLAPCESPSLQPAASSGRDGGWHARHSHQHITHGKRFSGWGFHESFRLQGYLTLGPVRGIVE